MVFQWIWYTFWAFDWVAWFQELETISLHFCYLFTRKRLIAQKCRWCIAHSRSWFIPHLHPFTNFPLGPWQPIPNWRPHTAVAQGVKLCDGRQWGQWGNKATATRPTVGTKPQPGGWETSAWQLWCFSNFKIHIRNHPNHQLHPHTLRFIELCFKNTLGRPQHKGFLRAMEAPHQRAKSHETDYSNCLMIQPPWDVPKSYCNSKCSNFCSHTWLK